MERKRELCWVKGNPDVRNESGVSVPRKKLREVSVGLRG